MTREQEEVIAAAREYGRWLKRVPLDEGQTYERVVGRLNVAAKALEESEKPKPKLWTPGDHGVTCSDRRAITFSGVSNFHGDDMFALASETVARALNLLERCGDKQCTWRTPGCACAVRCTCKST